MIKLTFCLRRLPGLSREAFQTYWREQHAPLVAKHAKTLGILKYVQVHTHHADLNTAIQGSRGSPEDYDGIAELWFESVEAVQQSLSDEAGAAAGAILLEDERKFIDLSRSPLWFNEEFVVVDAT